MRKLKSSKPKAIKITKSHPICEDIHSWRGGVYNCPHCNFRPDTENEMAWWHDSAHTVVLAIIHGKHEYAVSITTCPGCSNDSFQHINLNTTWTKWPKKVIDAMVDEMRRRQISSVRKFSKSLCLTCSKLQGIRIDTNARRICPIGSGEGETSCKSYQK